MKNTQTQKKNINIILTASIVLHVVALAAIAFLFYNVHALQKEADSLNKQSLQFNGRTNNLEGCWKNQDLECPENKYFDASQFMRDKK